MGPTASLPKKVVLRIFIALQIHRLGRVGTRETWVVCFYVHIAGVTMSAHVIQLRTVGTDDMPLKGDTSDTQHRVISLMITDP